MSDQENNSVEENISDEEKGTLPKSPKPSTSSNGNKRKANGSSKSGARGKTPTKRRTKFTKFVDDLRSDLPYNLRNKRSTKSTDFTKFKSKRSKIFRHMESKPKANLTSKSGTDWAVPSTSAGTSQNEGKIFITNLHENFRERSLRRIFSTVGPILRSTLHYDRYRNFLGTASVVYLHKDDAYRAVDAYNGRFVREDYIKVFVTSVKVPKDFKINSTTRLYLSNVNSHVKDLQRILDRFVRNTQGTIHYNRRRYSLSTADVVFRTGRDALNALRHFSGVKLIGTPLRVEMLTSHVPFNDDDTDYVSYDDDDDDDDYRPKKRSKKH